MKPLRLQIKRNNVSELIQGIYQHWHIPYFFTLQGVKGNMEISKLNGKPYYLKDVARVEDQKQQKLYIKHDVYPVDMYTTTDV